MKTLSICALLASVLLAGCDASTTTETSPADVGKESIQTVHQEFGKQQVRIAVMDRGVNSTSADFSYMEVEGMPCVVYYPTSKRGGISCDWSRWEGKTFKETLEPVKTTYRTVELPKFAQPLQQSPVPYIAPYEFND